MSSCTEKFENQVESRIGETFHSVGSWVGSRPRQTIALSILLTIATGYGFAVWETENRAEKLWVPQDTIAEEETEMYEEHFPSTARFNQLIVQSASSDNVLTKEHLEEALVMHHNIETGSITVDGKNYALEDICVQAGGSCVSGYTGICSCLVTSIFKQWNYDIDTLRNDTNYMQTLNEYGTSEDLAAILGNAVFDDEGNVLAAEAFSVTYFLQDQSEVVDGNEEDKIGEAWEEEVFLATAESAPTTYPTLGIQYFSTRSFADEFGGAITGDLLLVQISYVMAFLFLGANLGKVKCGTGSRWTMALGALATVGLSTVAGFGLSSVCGLFYGPVHSLLPFILLGIGVDDVFVIVNAFNRERKVPRASEDNDGIAKRSARALARAGASITVTSATDLVAFGISSSSKLPALASFCAYAAISIFFLWAFASTFFTGTLVLDERRQRDNRRECLCCLTRSNPVKEDEEEFKEDTISRYFRAYHAPLILSKVGKIVVLVIFGGLFGFGLYGAINLEVEDSERAFIPEGSYITDYIEAVDSYFPSSGIDLFFVFEGSSEIYEKRDLLAALDTRLTGLSDQSPYIAEPVSESTYQNVLAGLFEFLNTNGSDDIGNVTLGNDNWPTNEEDFVHAMKSFASITGPGAQYAQDVDFSDDGTQVDAVRVHSQYIKLTKINRKNEVIDDADKQIEAMDDTRTLVESWDDLPPAFPFSEKYIAIEGFKIIKRELFFNVGLAIAAVGCIVFLTVASPVTSLLITLNVAFCIVEILGFMYALGIVIDSVSVINIVLAVGLSVDYSAHVGHSFMTKAGSNKEVRTTEALADIGAAVLNGAISTFLAVVVLLFSSSYVFKVLSQQFALTVTLGITHGLILLPVLLTILGPKPYSSATDLNKTESDRESKTRSETFAE